MPKPAPKPLEEAKADVIKWACAQRDHDWNRDGANLIEALDDAVDEYRRSLAASAST